LPVATKAAIRTFEGVGLARLVRTHGGVAVSGVWAAEGTDANRLAPMSVTDWIQSVVGGLSLITTWIVMRSERKEAKQAAIMDPGAEEAYRAGAYDSASGDNKLS
jgi:hypothetical protein